MTHSAPSVDLVLDELEEGDNAFVFALDPEALELEHELVLVLAHEMVQDLASVWENVLAQALERVLGRASVQVL